MTPPRILVAGIGNIFLGDDAFGTEVAQRLLRRPQLPGVKVVDFGIRGLDLVYALLEEWDAAVLIDACPRSTPENPAAPGTLYVLDIQPPAGGGGSDAGTPDPIDLYLDGHNLDPARVLRLVAAMGGSVRRLLLVGCEPAPLPGPGAQADDSDVPSDADISMAMHPSVRAAIDEGVTLAESIVARLAAGQDPCGRDATLALNTDAPRERAQT